MLPSVTLLVIMYESRYYIKYFTYINSMRNCARVMRVSLGVATNCSAAAQAVLPSLRGCLAAWPLLYVHVVF